MSLLTFDVASSFMFFCPLTGTVILAPGMTEASDATAFDFDAASGELIVKAAACAAIRDGIVGDDGSPDGPGAGRLPPDFWERFSRDAAARIPGLVIFAFTRRPAAGDPPAGPICVGIDFAHVDTALDG